MLKINKLVLNLFWLVIVILILKINNFYQAGLVFDLVYYCTVSITLIISIKYFRLIANQFPFLIYLVFFHLAYFVLVELNLNGLNVDSISYMLARTFMFNFICTAFFFNVEYFRNVFVKDFSKLLLVIMIVSLIFPNAQNLQLYGIFNNPNSLGAIASIGLIFWQGNKGIKNYYFILGNLIFVIVILLTQSRGALLSIITLGGWYFFNNLKLIGLGAVLVFFTFLFFKDEMQQLPGIRRLVQQEEVLSGRDNEYDYALFRINQKPLSGWGMADHKDNLSASKYSERFDETLSAHNSYLTFIQLFGYIFGSGIILILTIPIITKTYQSVVYRYEIQNQGFLIVATYLVFHSFFESFMIGISHIVGFIFFTCFLMITSKFYRS